MHISTAARRRIAILALAVTGLAIALALALYGLRGNVTFFYSPSDIKGDQAQYAMPAHSFRLGGLVKEDSIKRNGKRLRFTVTDGAQAVPVVYKGIPPDLFREGQGVIATGRMDDNSTFQARRLLARHDENYMPPEVSDALERAENRTETKTETNSRNNSQ